MLFIIIVWDGEVHHGPLKASTFLMSSPLPTLNNDDK